MNLFEFGSKPSASKGRRY